VDDSSEVLSVQPSNVKALFRRAKAQLELKQFSRSLRDILLAEQVPVSQGAHIYKHPLLNGPTAGTRERRDQGTASTAE